jgi:hypothetical protein
VRLTPQFLRALHLELFTSSSIKALPQFNEKMVKMQIKMVKMVLPLLPETGKSPALLLQFNKKNNKIIEINIFAEP